MRTQRIGEDGDARAGRKRGVEMLMKRQLEDAARCTIIDCEDCSIPCINTIEVTRRSARTALAYRDMLERLEWVDNDYCPICRQYKANGHAADCELAALLRGSEGEKARDTIRLIETKPGYWECENCGESFECEPQKDKYRYCPYCGMRFDEYVSYVDEEEDEESEVEEWRKIPRRFTDWYRYE